MKPEDAIKVERYSCGHERKPILMNSSALAIASYLVWYEMPKPKPCLACWCKEHDKPWVTAVAMEGKKK